MRSLEGLFVDLLDLSNQSSASAAFDGPTRPASMGGVGTDGMAGSLAAGSSLTSDCGRDKLREKLLDRGTPEEEAFVDANDLSRIGMIISVGVKSLGADT